jgi:uncharacterized repeat protein (TIGR01451 family)
MMTKKNGIFTQVLGPVDLPTSPPAFLKMGLAASTGASINTHEIRNLVITSAGGIRTSKTVDKLNAKIGDKLVYSIDVFNQTDSLAKGLKLKETLSQIASYFKIDSVKFDNHGNSKTSVSNYSISDLSDITMDIAPISYCTFTLKGHVIGYPIGGLLTNSATVELGSSSIFDPDLINNTSSVSTIVESPAIAPDFVISQTVSQTCADLVSGNTLTLKVRNAGLSGSVAGSIVTVTDTIPTNLTVISATGSGWNITNVGNKYSFTRSEKLNINTDYPAIDIKVKPSLSAPETSWTNKAFVANENDLNTFNNRSELVTLNAPPDAKAGSDQTVYTTGTLTLAANAPVVGSTGLWTVRSGSAILTDSSKYNTTVKLFPNTTATLRWTVSNGGCSSYDEVIVNYFAPKLTLVKTVSNGPLFKLGSEIKYTLTATNAGLVALNSVALTDKRLAAAPILLSGDI